MNKNDIKLIEDAYKFFKSSGFALPGLNDFKYSGRFLNWEVVNFEMTVWDKVRNYSYASIILSDNSEYCEKLSHLEDVNNYCFPVLCHNNKKKDLICRKGTFYLNFNCDIENSHCNQHEIKYKLNNIESKITCSDHLYMQEGERVTINPGTYHDIWIAEEHEMIDQEFCEYGDVIKNDIILGEISTYDDKDDFCFLEQGPYFIDYFTDPKKIVPIQPKVSITKYIYKLEDGKLVIEPK